MADGAPGFSFEMASTGNAFPFGDVSATFTSKGKEPVNVAFIRSVASYLPQRTIKYPFTLPKDLKIASGTLKVEYLENEEAGGKALASIEIPVK